MNICVTMTQDARHTGMAKGIYNTRENPDFCYIKYLGRHRTFPISTCTEMHFY